MIKKLLLFFLMICVGQLYSDNQTFYKCHISRYYDSHVEIQNVEGFYQKAVNDPKVYIADHDDEFNIRYYVDYDNRWDWESYGFDMWITNQNDLSQSVYMIGSSGFNKEWRWSSIIKKIDGVYALVENWRTKEVIDIGDDETETIYHDHTRTTPLSNHFKFRVYIRHWEWGWAYRDDKTFNIIIDNDKPVISMNNTHNDLEENDDGIIEIPGWRSNITFKLIADDNPEGTDYETIGGSGLHVPTYNGVNGDVQNPSWYYRLDAYEPTALYQLTDAQGNIITEFPPNKNQDGSVIYHTVDTEGRHQYTFMARDRVGNESFPVSYLVQIDRTAPPTARVNFINNQYNS